MRLFRKQCMMRGALFSAITSLSIVVMAAQSRWMDSTAFSKRAWLRLDSTQQFRKASNALTMVPPLTPSMPWQRMLEYVVLDSVCRVSERASTYLERV